MHVYPAPEQTTSFGPGTHAIESRYMKYGKWASIPKFVEIKKTFDGSETIRVLAITPIPIFNLSLLVNPKGVEK
jgi:hypothetical protein